jgi:hypothetical protein
MNKQNKGFMWVVAVVVLVVVLAIIGIWYFYAHRSHGVASVPKGTPVFAEQGQVVQGFPKELILDSNALVTGSYSVAFASSSNQYTVEWNSSSSMASLFASYKDYFTKSNWTVTNSSTVLSGIHAISAASSTGSAGVVIAAQKEGAKVTISYVKN